MFVYSCWLLLCFFTFFYLSWLSASSSLVHIPNSNIFIFHVELWSLTLASSKCSCVFLLWRFFFPSMSEVLLVPALTGAPSALDTHWLHSYWLSLVTRLQRKRVLPLRWLKTVLRSADFLPRKAAKVLAAIGLQDSGGCSVLSSTLHTIIKHD